MLARRLLASGGSGGFTVPEITMTLVASLGKLANTVLNNNTAFPWGFAEGLDTAWATWTIGDSTKLYIVQDSWFLIGADITTLGTEYSGANNADWLTLIGRNGIDLAHTIIGERHYHSAGTTADAMSIMAPRYLLAGDYLQLYTQNAGGSSLLIEANPSGGPTPPTPPADYTGESGTGVISPHLYLIRLAGAP